VTTQWTPEIADGVFFVGVRDHERRLFDSLIPLPQGTTYNSHLVRGEEKTALVDTVNPGFESDLLDRVASVCGEEAVDYVIMNHAEPDHAGAIPQVMARYPGATLLAGERGAQMAERYFGVSSTRLKVVDDGEEVNLGKKTLRFLSTPMLHWPETIMTYFVEQRVLFSCDFFGTHTAAGLYAREVPELIPFAKRYFGEIMMPFRAAGRRALERIDKLDIETIAPSHGPVHADPEMIVDSYRHWCAGETGAKATVVYVSMWGSTVRLVRQLTDQLSARGLEVGVHELSTADLGDIARDLVDSRTIVLGSPTVLGGLHPLASHAVNLVAALKPPARYAAFVGSYGWSGGALNQVKQMVEPTGLEIVGGVDIHGPPDATAREEVDALADAIAQAD